MVPDEDAVGRAGDSSDLPHDRVQMAPRLHEQKAGLQSARAHCSI